MKQQRVPQLASCIPRETVFLCQRIADLLFRFGNDINTVSNEYHLSPLTESIHAMLTKEEENNWDDLVPKAITLPAVYFFMEQERIEGLRWYFSGADYLFHNHLESVQTQFQKIFSSLDSSIAPFLMQSVATKEAAQRTFNSDTYQAILGHALMSRAVDNFSTYLKDLLAGVVRAKPELLKSNDKQSLEFILSFDNMGDLRTALAERKIESLFYGSIKDVTKFYVDRLGLQIFSDSQIELDVEYAFRVRNLIVHNRGRIDKQYLIDFPSPNLTEGAILAFDFQDVSHYNLMFQKILVRLDKIVATKFNLATFSNYPVLDPKLKVIKVQEVRRR